MKEKTKNMILILLNSILVHGLILLTFKIASKIQEYERIFLAIIISLIFLSMCIDGYFIIVFFFKTEKDYKKEQKQLKLNKY